MIPLVYVFWNSQKTKPNLCHRKKSIFKASKKPTRTQNKNLMS